LKFREQVPKVHQRENGDEPYWYFRYWNDELLPNGLVRTTRELYRIGLCFGPTALTRLQAQAERDNFLRTLAIRRAAPAEIMPNEASDAREILFGKLASMWEWDYVERVVGGKSLVAASTKQKYRNHLHNHILPRWASKRTARYLDRWRGARVCRQERS